MYQGLVIDQLKSLETRKTRLYTTYQEAHKAAEKLCKRTYGDRGGIDVIIIDSKKRYDNRLQKNKRDD
ncbi:hypothetical protein PCURB6_28220 [Paenibacillus curdlanolyticus]|nr:hypothetical protein PCURB6_28220 [Paenibacillus curdlanolyticus]